MCTYSGEWDIHEASQGRDPSLLHPTVWQSHSAQCVDLFLWKRDSQQVFDWSLWRIGVKSTCIFSWIFFNIDR